MVVTSTCSAEATAVATKLIENKKKCRVFEDLKIQRTFVMRYVLLPIVVGIAVLLLVSTRVTMKIITRVFKLFRGAFVVLRYCGFIIIIIAVIIRSTKTLGDKNGCNRQEFNT